MKHQLLLATLIMVALSGCMKVTAVNPTAGRTPSTNQGGNMDTPGGDSVEDPGPIGVVDPNLTAEREFTVPINGSLPSGGHNVIFNTTATGHQTF